MYFDRFIDAKRKSSFVKLSGSPSMNFGKAFGFNTQTTLFLFASFGFMNQPGKTTTGLTGYFFPVQLFNIFSRFVGYHAPVVVKDGNGKVDPSATLHDEGMRNAYRFFRGFMPLEKLSEIEHGIYPYDIETERQKDETKETK